MHSENTKAKLVCRLETAKYSGRKITESLGNVTVRGEKRWKEQEGSAIVNSLFEHV
jgi:hypothetical protein